MSELQIKKESRKRVKHPDRIYLSGTALEMLSVWMEQVHKELPGIKVTKSDLVNWRFKNESTTLSEKNLRDIERVYFNPVKFAKWAAKEVELSHARGEPKTLREILESRHSPNPRKPRSLSKQSKDSAIQNSPKTSDSTKEP